MWNMDQTVALFIIGGLCAALMALFGYFARSNERRIQTLEAKVSALELQIANRLTSIETKLEQLIER